MIELDARLKLSAIVDSENIAPELSDKDKNKIASELTNLLNDDKSSVSEWDEHYEQVKKLTDMKIESSTLLPEMPKAKIPLINWAVSTLAARTYPEIIRDNKPVMCSVLGPSTDEKQKKAHQVSNFMSWQLLRQNRMWASQMDKSIRYVLTYGICFKKIYYKTIERRNCSDLVYPQQIILDNNTTDLETARLSHLYELTRNEVIERQRRGLYDIEKDDEILKPNYTDVGGSADFIDDYSFLRDLSKTSSDTKYKFAEVHAWLDLDGDDYEEPYVITLHLSTGRLVRVVSRFNTTNVERNKKNEVMYIKPLNFFTSTHCLPAQDGTFFSYGLGTLLSGINKTCNVIAEELVEAGAMANQQGFLMGTKGLASPGGEIAIPRGTIKLIPTLTGEELSKAIVPMNFKEPSATLYTLLGFMMSLGKELGLVDLINENTPANAGQMTMMSMVEEGLHTASYFQRRIRDGLQDEFDKLYHLNSIYLNPVEYAAFQDESIEVSREDFEDKELDISPTINPKQSSDIQRMLKAQMLMDISKEGQGILDPVKVMTRFLRAIEIENPEELLSEPQQPAPDPQLMAVQAEYEVRNKELQLKVVELQMKQEKNDADIVKIKAQSIESLANAEATEAGNQMAFYRSELDSLMAGIKTYQQQRSLSMAEQAEQAEQTEQVPTESAPQAEPMLSEAVPEGVTETVPTEPVVE